MTKVTHQGGEPLRISRAPAGAAKAKQIALRLGPDVLLQVEAHAHAHGVSLNAISRSLVIEGLRRMSTDCVEIQLQRGKK